MMPPSDTLAVSWDAGEDQYQNLLPPQKVHSVFTPRCHRVVKEDSSCQ